VDKTVAPAGTPFAGMALARPLWPHQEKALVAFEQGRNRHHRPPTWSFRPAAARR